MLHPITVNILQDPAALEDFITNSWRPHGFSPDGRAVDANGQIIGNAWLNREEWERLDAVVMAMGKQRLGAWQDVINAGLRSNTTLAEEFSKWRVASERTEATVSMDFRTRVDYDRTDRKTYGVPIPIFSAAFSMGRRELAVVRATGGDVETFEAEQAAEAVAEKVEATLVNGNTDVVIGGSSIAGYTTLSARDTGTAAAYGGGDFGTITNIYPTFTGMMAALAAKRFYGPFGCYLASTQYNQMLDFYSDGSGQKALDRVVGLNEIQFVKPHDLMTDGELLMVQLTRDVVDVRIGLSLETRRWETPSGSEMHFLVVFCGTPRVKQNYEGNAGIAHATAC